MCSRGSEEAISSFSSKTELPTRRSTAAHRTADFAVLDRLPLDPNTAVKGCETKERGMPGPYVALGNSLSIGFSASSPSKGYVGLLDSAISRASG